MALFHDFASDVEFLVLPGRLRIPLARIWRDQVTVPFIVRRNTDLLLTPSSVGSVLASVPQVVIVPAHLAFRTVRDALDAPSLSAIHKFYYGPMMRLSHRRAAAVAPLSEFLGRKLIEDNGLPPTKVRPILLGVDPAPSISISVRPERNPYALFVGTLYPYKNANTLIDAFALAADKLPANFGVVIVGRDPDGHQTSALLERARAAGEPIARAVRVLGSVDDVTLEQLYAEATMLVFPSSAEGFGLPVLEAMARGVPVLASDRTALPEVMGGAGLLFDPSSPATLAELMASVARDTSLRERLIQAGRDRAAELSWDRTAWDYVQLFATATKEAG